MSGLADFFKRLVRRTKGYKQHAGADPTCRCGHLKSKHGLHGFPDCTDGAGDFFCLCSYFTKAS